MKIRHWLLLGEFSDLSNMFHGGIQEWRVSFLFSFFYTCFMVLTLLILYKQVLKFALKFPGFRKHKIQDKWEKKKIATLLKSFLLHFLMLLYRLKHIWHVLFMMTIYFTDQSAFIIFHGLQNSFWMSFSQNYIYKLHFFFPFL